MKKLSLCIITALSLLSLGILTACGVSATPKEAGSAQLPNPFIPCASIEDANEILGFTAAVPSILPDGYETAAIAAVSSSDPAFVQIRYENGEKTITYRIGKGSGNISGDYNSYEFTKTLEAVENILTCSGAGELIYNAVWEADGYTYSLTATDGITENELQELVESIA